MDELEKARREKRNKEHRAAIDSINWDALQAGYNQSFNEKTGRYTGAEGYVEKKNAAINLTLENKKKL